MANEKQTAEMYLFKVFSKASSGGERTDYEAEPTPLPLDPSELKERREESKMGLLSVKSTRYYVVAVDDYTRTLWIWTQYQLKGMAASFWKFSHRDADLPQGLIARSLDRKELESYRYSQIFRGNEPKEFWDMFARAKALGQSSKPAETGKGPQTEAPAVTSPTVPQVGPFVQKSAIAAALLAVVGILPVYFLGAALLGLGHFYLGKKGRALLLLVIGFLPVFFALLFSSSYAFYVSLAFVIPIWLLSVYDAYRTARRPKQ